MAVANHAKHAFYYILILITLGFVTVGAGQVLFSIIEHFLPDVVNAYNSYSSGVNDSVLRFGLSSLLVASPIYYFLTTRINRDLEEKEIDPMSGIRRWLTYAIILIASVTAIGDLIASFNSFLSGELTMRFALKALVILVIAAAVLTYYTFDLTRKDFHRGTLLRWYNVGFLVAIIVTFVVGIVISTSPSVLRERQLDSDRLSDLQAIESAVNQYYAENDTLPVSLDALLADKKIFAEQTSDPVTKAPYTYRTAGEQSFELCATFTQPATEQQEGFYFGAEWQHKVGEECFSRDVQTWAIDQAAGTTPAKPVR